MSAQFFVGGQPFRLGKEIGRGGEGAVFEVSSWPNYVTKLYHSHVLADASRAAKLEQKIAAQLRLVELQREPWLAWPLEFVRDAQGRFAGVIMQRLEGTLLQRLMAPVSAAEHFRSWTQSQLLTVCRHLAAHQHRLEGVGVFVADMGPGNFLVNPQDASVRMIDCDAYQIGVGREAFPCEVLAPNFSAPEVLNRTVPGLRTPSEVHFGAALLFFAILTLGASAFMQVGGAGVPENIRAGRIAIGGANASAFMPATYYARYAALTPWLKKLFNDTLRRGHGQPALRTGFREWERAFANALQTASASLNSKSS